MELKPVEKIDPPNYPADEDLADAKSMLSDHIPCRWRKAKGLAGAAAVFLAANLSGGCGRDISQNDAPSPEPIEVQVDPPILPYPSTNPNPVFDDANKWVNSIFAEKIKSQPLLMGKRVIVTPHGNEDAIPGIIRDNTK
jgi:hypothetical protein